MVKRSGFQATGEGNPFSPSLWNLEYGRDGKASDYQNFVCRFDSDNVCPAIYDLWMIFWCVYFVGRWTKCCIRTTSWQHCGRWVW